MASQAASTTSSVAEVPRAEGPGSRTLKPPLPASLRQEFQELSPRWRLATEQSSDPLEKIAHPAHLRIIGLGPQVLPLVFSELADRGGLWFWALEALTGDDPVIQPATMKEVREAWLSYGRQHGYV
jgi:hypothetical protein